MYKKVLEISYSFDDYRMDFFLNDKWALLGSFLTSDYFLFKKFNFTNDWLDDASQYLMSGNLIYLKKHNGAILIGDLFEKEPASIFEVSMEAFKKLLDDWDQAIKQNPKEIIITKEGDSVMVEGKN